MSTTTNTLIMLPPARRYFKKIKEVALRQLFEESFQKIMDDPTVGQAKTGDLSGVYAYGFRYQKTEYRIAYKVEVNADGSLTIIIMIGTHENFYDELKAYLN